MEFLSTFARQFIFFSGDVQTTTIAMAITGSLCCSIMAAIVQIVTWANSQPVNAHGTHEAFPLLEGQKYDTQKGEESGSKAKVRRCSEDSRRSSHPSLHEQDSMICPKCGSSKSLEWKYWGSVSCSDCSSTKQTTTESVSPNISTTPSPLRVNKQVTIDLSFQRIEKWPSRLGFIGSNLRRLNLSNNSVANLPSEVGCLSGLQDLCLANNKLQSLPTTMASLRQLETLNVRFNQFKTIPECVFSLSSLMKLVLSCNCLESIPGEIENLRVLTRLSVDHNCLKALPDQLCKLTNLEVLNCSHNSLSHIPERVGELVRLRELSLTSCHLTCLPDMLTRCAGLHVLRAGNNRLTSIPVQIGRLHGLRELHVHSNNISVFPASLAGLSLQHLAVRGNPARLAQFVGEELSVHAGVEFPPLLELTARFISQHKLPWETTGIPDSHKALLRDCRQCSRCEGRCFRYYSSTIRLRSVGPDSLRLPLQDTACSSHSFCYFRP